MKIKKNGQIITLTESDLNRIVKQVKLSEQSSIVAPKSNLPECLGKCAGIKKSLSKGETPSSGDIINCLFSVSDIETLNCIKEELKKRNIPVAY